MLPLDDPPPSQLNQVSNEKGPVPKFNFSEFSSVTYPPFASNFRAFPTFPGARVTPLVVCNNVLSSSSQLTKPEGSGAQLCAGGGGSLPPPPPPHSCGCTLQ